MDRRQFSTALAALGIVNAASAQSVTQSGTRSGVPPGVHVETLQLSRNGWMPNNEYLPVLIYRHAFHPSSALAGEMEQVFEHNRWPPQWRNGVYDFHHYHSTAHEVLGFAAGSATIVLGGEGGQQVTVEAGDVAILPTGTGHCRIAAAPDFLVIGAYPGGQHWDICRAAPNTAAIARMVKLPFPASDPVTGPSGSLVSAWRVSPGASNDRQ